MEEKEKCGLVPLRNSDTGEEGLTDSSLRLDTHVHTHTHPHTRTVSSEFIAHNKWCQGRMSHVFWTAEGWKYFHASNHHEKTVLSLFWSWNYKRWGEPDCAKSGRLLGFKTFFNNQYSHTCRHLSWILLISVFFFSHHMSFVFYWDLMTSTERCCWKTGSDPAAACLHSPITCDWSPAKLILLYRFIAAEQQRECFTVSYLLLPLW